VVARHDTPHCAVCLLPTAHYTSALARRFFWFFKTQFVRLFSAAARFSRTHHHATDAGGKSHSPHYGCFLQHPTPPPPPPHLPRNCQCWPGDARSCVTAHCSLNAPSNAQRRAANGTGRIWTRFLLGDRRTGRGTFYQRCLRGGDELLQPRHCYSASLNDNSNYGAVWRRHACLPQGRQNLFLAHGQA